MGKVPSLIALIDRGIWQGGRWHSQLVKEEVGLICIKYSTATRDSLAKLDSKCEERSKYRYFPTAYLMSSDFRCYGQLINKMENN